MMNRKKLWCFMKAFSYPLSILGIFAFMLLAVAIEMPEIMVILAIISIALIVIFVLAHVLDGLSECYDDYEEKIEEIKRNDKS